VSEIILQIIMLLSAFVAGYSARAIHKPVQKRASNGRFAKK